MKRCQKCNFQSDAMLDYCWQCGSQLVNFSNPGNFYRGAARTQAYSLPNGAPPFNNYGQNYQQNYGQNYAPNYQPRASSVSFGRVALVLGSIFVFLLMAMGAVSFVVYRVVNEPPVPRYEPPSYRAPEPANSPSSRKAPVISDPADTTPGATFDKIWVDYNVRENGRLGMRIHVKFWVFNLKDVDTDLAIYFEKADGTKLKSSNRNFSSKDGQVAVYRALKPAFVNTTYNDLDVFMPYDELKLSKGKYDLKMDADVICKNGDLVEHLDYYDFQYEKF